MQSWEPESGTAVVSAECELQIVDTRYDLFSIPTYEILMFYFQRYGTHDDVLNLVTKVLLRWRNKACIHDYRLYNIYYASWYAPLDL